MMFKFDQNVSGKIVVFLYFSNGNDVVIILAVAVHVHRNVVISAPSCKLPYRNEKVSDLNENINELNTNLDEMTVQNAAQQATIENQDAMLNTVWVCIAPQQTLVEKGILSKGGLFQSSAISKQGFDKTQFVEGNKRELELIPLNTKKPTIMTNHPESSYQINEGEGGAKTLQILDKEAFWSMSNYLVVSIK